MEESNLCAACLSSERVLTKISENFLNEIKLKELSSPVTICWECYAVIDKFIKLKRKVNQAQYIINNGLRNLKTDSLSTLKTSNTKTNYDYEIKHENKERKAEQISIKQDYADNEIDEATHMYVDTIKYESGILNKKPIFNEPLNINTTETQPLLKLKEKIIYKNRNIKNKIQSTNSLKTYTNKQNTKKLKNNTSFIQENNKDIIRSNKNNEQLNSKFEEVILSEEALRRVLEEKSLQPNYLKIPYKCDMCVLGFTKKENYDIHFLTKHNQTIGPHECKLCKTRFGTAPSMERHLKRHYRYYKCRLCVYKTSLLKAMLNHCNSKHKGDSLNEIHCSICSYVADSQNNMSVHSKTHFLICNQCGEKFKGKNTLRAHLVRIHSSKRQYSCDICKKSFSTKSRLESHLSRHNDSIAKSLAFCSVCNVQYKDIQVYRNHLRNNVIHAKERYACSECNKKFASKVYFTKHYNFYHLKKTQFKCEDCDKLFISKWRLINHKQKHHGLKRDRDKECDVCGKKFYNTSTLRTHKQIHGIREYMCHVCGRTFNQQSALYAHSNRIHK